MKETKIEPGMNVSLGWKLAGHNYLGVQVNPWMSQKNTESVMKINVGATTVEMDNKNTTRSTGMEGSAGYYRQWKEGEFGLMLRSGEILFQKVRDSGKDSDGNKGDDTAKNMGKYVKGPTVIMGGYHELGSYLGAALEISVQCPRAFTLDTLEYSYDDKAVVTVANKTDVKAVNILRGGLAFYPTDRLAFTTGLSFSYSRIRELEYSRNPAVPDKEKMNKAKNYTGTLGLDYNFRNECYISFLAAYGRVRMVIDDVKFSTFSGKVEQTRTHYDLSLLLLGFALTNKY